MTRLNFGVSDENASLSEGLDMSETNDIDSSKPFHFLHEARQLFQIAAPSVIIQFCLFFIFPTAASSVGRNVGTTALAAFSLGSLIGNLTCLSIMEGALTAADTLMPRAYGAQRFDEIGRIAIRGTLTCILLLVAPVVPLYFCADDILISLRQDPEASALAQEWIRIYFWGIPPNLLFRIGMRFLLSQNKPWPLVVASAIPCIFCMPLLLCNLVPSMGLQGSALSIVIVQWSTAAILAVHMWIWPMHKTETWPGLSVSYIKEALQPAPLLHFMRLSVGGIFSMMEWWFFETMCIIAGSFGVVALCVHTIAYNLVPLFFMVPLGILIGLTVRMGHVIVEYPGHAKLMATWCMAFTAFLGIVAASGLYQCRHAVIRSFTADQYVIEGALEIWGRLCCYIVLLYIFGISQAILRALGMQWRLAAIIAVYLYFITLPAVVYFAMIHEGGLLALWTVLSICYVFLQIVLALGYTTVDWTKHAESIHKAMLHKSLATLPGQGWPKQTGMRPTEATQLLESS